ncbi:MAG: PGPGW domain-containing protein [Rhizobiaceae bacterium]
MTMTEAEDRYTTSGSEEGRTIHLFGKAVRLPRSRAQRIAIGIVLVILGMFGFLPILGFWMIPLGLLVLSYEFAKVRRWRRKLQVGWGRWRNR